MSSRSRSFSKLSSSAASFPSLENGLGLVQLRSQRLVLPPWPGILPLHWIDRRALRRLAQRLQRAALGALRTPGTDQRGVQAFPAQ
jgi:hypothetical protein